MDKELIWHDAATLPPHGGPVIAEFHEFNRPSNPVHQQVVWFWEGEWRSYPDTENLAYVDRWRELPAIQGTADNARIAELEEALAMAFAAIDDHNHRAAFRSIRIEEFHPMVKIGSKVACLSDARAILERKAS